MLNYFAIIVSFLGLMFGKLLAKHAHDEVKVYKNKINFARRLVLLAIILLTLFLSLGISSLIFSAIAALAAIFIMRYLDKTGFKTDYIFLGIIAVCFFILKIDTLLFVITLLIFLYGLFYGSLNPRLNILTHILTFFLPALLLFLPLSYIGYMLTFSATCLAFLFKD